MKTLCLSLLRLGDFFHHMHLLTQIEGADKGDVQILAFDECKPAASLYPQFKFHFIPRSQLQFELVEKHRNWKRAIHILGAELRRVNTQKFDRIFNLTHTTFAARCLDLLQAPEKRGLHFEDGRVQGWNPMLKYINDIWRDEQSPLMNWVEVTALSLGLNEPPMMEAEDHLLAREIWLQPLTSDDRKNWSFTDWKNLAGYLTRAGFKVRVLGAPSEAAILKPEFGDMVSTLTFQEMRMHKGNCRLLISGDTSVLHFAVLEKIPVHGIFLGPANAYKTPPRQVGSVVWTLEHSFSAKDVAAAALAYVHGLDIANYEQVPFGQINAFGRLHYRNENRRDDVETTGRLLAEGTSAAGSGRRDGQEDAGI